VPLNVSALDLTGIARRLADKSYTTEPLFIAGAIYIVLAFALARLFRWLEVRFYIPSR
jgi:ABC-type arginine/histidine transport system permease subunit